MDVQVGLGMFFDLPTGFHRSAFEGFGVDPRISYIISAFDEVPGAAGLTICNDEESPSMGRKFSFRSISTTTFG